MARAFKEITGSITKLNEPYFAEQRGLWVMMVKENDRWIAINSRDEKKIRDYHGLLETRRTAKTLNITVQPTTLSQEKVKMAEYAFGILGETPAKDIVDAAQLLCQQKVKQQTPMVAEAADLFYEKQSKRQLSEATLRDYRRLVKYLKNEFANKRVGELTSQDITRYIEQPKHPASQRARFIYLQTFVNFCSGKRNAHCSDAPWITSKILQWEPAKTDFHEISAYSYEEIIAVLKAAKSFDVLPYFIFRLFSLMRTDEFHRFTEIHTQVKEHPLVSIESQRITINAQIFGSV